MSSSRGWIGDLVAELELQSKRVTHTLGFAQYATQVDRPSPTAGADFNRYVASPFCYGFSGRTSRGPARLTFRRTTIAREIIVPACGLIVGGG